MTEHGFKHKLAAILSADVVGYSRLIGDDEVSAVRILNAYRDKMTAQVVEYSGRVVDFVGDNMLAEFSSTFDAVNCAVHMQRELRHHNENLTPDRRMEFRFGLHMGDIMVDGERIYGDGVNLAARLQSLAEPGGICISEGLYQQVRSRFDFQFVDLGEKELKNFPEPVRVYRIADAENLPPPPAIATRPVKRPPLSPPLKPSLTVIPFVNLGAESEPDHFCDGLTLDIMSGLTQIPGLVLISWVSMGNTARSPLSTQAIGKQLGVNHALDGGMRRSGDRVRITARLVETSRGRQVWAKRFDCRLDDIFAVQDEITQEIIVAMDVQLVSGSVARVIRQAFRNPGAIESYYRGWGALFRSSRADILLAQQMAEKTIRLEPESPVGYSLAAFSHWWAVAQHASDNVSLALDQATKLARQAMHLKDATGLPDLVLAQIHLLQREHEQALSAAGDSLIVRPSCHASYAVKANVLNYMGRFAEAVELAEFAIRLAPIYPSYYSMILAAAYYGNQRYEDAIASAEVSLSIDPQNLDALLVIACANIALDRIQESHQAAREVMQLRPTFSLGKYTASQPYKDPKDLEKMTAMLRKAGLPE